MWAYQFAAWGLVPGWQGIDSTVFKVLAIGHSMHAKDSYQSGLKRQILIMLLCTPVGIAKKRPMVHFFSEAILSNFAKSADFVSGMIQNQEVSSRLEVPTGTIVNYISTANFLMKNSVLTMAAANMHGVHSCWRLLLLSLEQAFPQKEASHGSYCMALENPVWYVSLALESTKVYMSPR